MSLLWLGATSVKVRGIDRPKSRAGSHDFTVENRTEINRNSNSNSSNHNSNTHHTLLSNDLNNNNDSKNRGGERGERGVKNNEKDSQCSSSQQGEFYILSEVFIEKDYNFITIFLESSVKLMI